MAMAATMALALVRGRAGSVDYRRGVTVERGGKGADQ